MTRAQLDRRLKRLEGAVAPPVAPLPPLAPIGDETGALAQELGSAFGEMVRSYQDIYKLTPAEAAARVADLSACPERALIGPPDQVTWFDLNEITRRDPALALQRWEEVKEAARQEVRSGHRAARALEEHTGRCWSRARFLAVRAELAEAWAPRDAQEQQLIDQLAQLQTLLWVWQETLTGYSQLVASGCRKSPHAPAPGEPPRLSDAEAADRATAMVERLHRLYLRTLQALQARRRGTVVVRRAGQVNIGQHQVNVSG